jgi:zinc finger HIT domain-containing protein 1
MFRVELISDTSTATPGWSYAPTRGFDPTQAMAPTLSRKRGIRDAGKGADLTSRQANAIARHIADLDRENQRDVSIPAPVKQAREAGARGTRAKTTSNVRRILASQKTFRNHLDDEEAAIASGGGGIGGLQGLGGANVVAQARGSIAAKGAKAAAARRSSTPASAAGVKRSSAAMGGADTSVVSTPKTDGEMEMDMEVDTEVPQPEPKLIKSEYDNDPLLRSYAPPVPSDRLMQRLLAEPPLSYNGSRAKPPASRRPGRRFCCMCGYWGKIRCKSCHLRTCGLDCYKVHEDSRCGAFF